MNIISVGRYEVYFTFEKGHRGTRDSLGGIHGAGPPLEPDTLDSVELEKVLDVENGVDCLDELTTAELIEIELSCLNHICQQYQEETD